MFLNRVERGILEPPHHNAHPSYRSDIDGLRAVAILSVVIFHAFPRMLSGGFVGVDIFFVISGFLISSILFKSIQSGGFSFSEFYAGRIRRIFPALLLVLLCAYVFGWLVLLPDEFKQLGNHIAAGAGFIQNFVLWKEAGYFDTATELKPLMHLWSLAVEEQFYLLYPLLIWLAWRMRLNLLAVVIVLGLLSFYLNVSEIKHDTVKTFFLPQTRFWELLAGAGLAYFELFKHLPPVRAGGRYAWGQSVSGLSTGGYLQSWLSFAGVLLIGLAVAGLDKSALFPGWWALAPVIGAVLIIFAGPDAWLNRRILSHRWLVFVGLISYPLYLWHWMLLSFVRITGIDFPFYGAEILAVALSGLLAWLTFEWVEKPIRFGSRTWKKTTGLTLLMALVGYVGYNAFLRDGLPFRSAVRVHAATLQDLSWEPSKLHYFNCTGSLVDDEPKLGYCQRSRLVAPSYAIIGDSHADHLFHGVAKLASDSWLLIGNHSCPPVTGVRVTGIVQNCDELIDKAIDAVIKTQTIHTVVLSFFGNYALNTNYAADHIAQGVGPATIQIASDRFKTDNRAELLYLGLEAAVTKLEQAKKSVVVVMDVPELPFFPRDCVGRPFFSVRSNQCSLLKTDVLERQQVLRGIMQHLQVTHPAVRLFDPLPFFCDEKLCHVKLNDFLLYRDSHHLSLRGSDFLAERFLKWLN